MSTTPDSAETGATLEPPVTAHNVDLSNCDRELVQYCGAIQPHGALLVLQEPELTIMQVSANTAALFGIPPEALLQQNVTQLLGDAQTQMIRTRLARASLKDVPVHVLRVLLPGCSTAYNAFVHRSDGVLLLELEVVEVEAHAALPDLYSELRGCINQLQATTSLQAFFDLAVEHIRHFIGFDRVVAYKFHEDGSGEVIAESRQAELEPYLGLHYPAVDIPAPARRLFSLSWLRHLPDVDYTAIPLVPERHPQHGGPLDLSYSLLRSVSVMYSGYLKNMGVKSTMVMTLLKNGQLWGLISCMHHTAPRHVPYEVRMAGEFLAHMVSLLMCAKENVETYEYRLRLTATLDQLVARMVRSSTWHDGLVHHEPHVLSTLRAQGAAVLVGDRLTLLGHTPSHDDVHQLAAWLAGQPEAVFATPHLAGHYPPAAAFRECASGVLAARLSGSQPDFVMWFRPEVIQEVRWAGDPHKPVEVCEEDGAVRLLPRTSFALWKETVYAQARPWAPCEIVYANDLRCAILGVIAEQTAELARINRELAQSSVELDAFAHVASHDLKEPLRGIHNFAAFLQQEEGERVSEQGKARLETILRLTQRMDDLIESLLHYSRVGRVDLVWQPVSLHGLLTQTLELLRVRLDSGNVQVRVPRPLPIILCDQIRVAEVFTNLITNAIKYNDKATRWIEIGYEDAEPPVLYVRDNGIGIASRHFEQIFQIFRRLHGRHEYGGGTGAGLTIAKRAIERHGGRIWLESTPGVGSTFYFTLAPAREA